MPEDEDLLVPLSSKEKEVSGFMLALGLLMGLVLGSCIGSCIVHEDAQKQHLYECDKEGNWHWVTPSVNK